MMNASAAVQATIEDNAAHLKDGMPATAGLHVLSKQPSTASSLPKLSTFSVLAQAASGRGHQPLVGGFL